MRNPANGITSSLGIGTIMLSRAMRIKMPI
jgi:hypothetical protein